jgi:EAL domain-containing protein (putative c-di-GMP-specific phosphodiesterase class I)
VIESSSNIAKVQLKKVHNLHRELMHTLIQDDHLTYSHFQGIFHLGSITKENVDESEKTSSFAPIADQLYGFESLIRVRTDLLNTHLEKDQVVVESQYLRPDVLFSLAKATKTSLELDQACLRSAAEHCKGLPGVLMVNILPRNLYFIERLQKIFNGHPNLIFEVSESEAISNFDLMNQVREYLRQNKIGIAADDFGRGFAGLERVIKIEPDIIKFDRSLISNIHEDPIKHAYVSGLVKASKMLNTIVLAEGIEKWEEAEVLKELGIELAQGFLFHKPQTKDHVQLQLEEAKSAKNKLTKLGGVA